MKITNELLKNALGISTCFEFEAMGISIDSRNIKKNEVFIAIKGNNFDGNEFIRSALNNGAIASIIDKKEYHIPGKTILVNDSLEALKKIGLYIKNNVNLKATIGITGSVGKTTTKFWLNYILNCNYKSFSSIKNYNTIYGLSISLSLLEDDIDFGIFELGSNNPGEIFELSNYLSPDIGIITNIYESHIGRFNNISELAKEKISIIDGLKDEGILIFDGDSEFLCSIKNKSISKNLKLISVGFSENCDFSILSFENKVKLKTPFGIIDYKINASGRHFAYISAFVIASLFALKLNIKDFIGYFERLTPIEGRGIINSFEFRNKKFKVIDDSYNASPSSMLASIENLNSMKSKSKIAVIGQMKELGDRENYYHKLIFEKLNEYNFEYAFFVGDEELWNIFNKSSKVICFSKIDDFAIEKILEIIQNESIVLLKGSRSIELNKFIDYIKCSIV